MFMGYNVLLHQVFFLGLNPSKLLPALKANQVLQKDSISQSYHFFILSHNKATLPLSEFSLPMVLQFFRLCHHPTVIT